MSAREVADRDSGLWHRVRVSIATTEGEKAVDGFAHPLLPGLAVTPQMNTMGFTCTHILTGRSFGFNSALALRCCVWLLEYALVCDVLGVDPVDHLRFREVGKTLGTVTAVPFGDYTITEYGETRPMTCAEWFGYSRDQFGDPEYIAFGELDLREQKLIDQLQERLNDRSAS